MSELEYLGLAYTVLVALRALLAAASRLDLRDGTQDWPAVAACLGVVEWVADLLSVRLGDRK